MTRDIFSLAIKNECILFFYVFNMKNSQVKNKISTSKLILFTLKREIAIGYQLNKDS